MGVRGKVAVITGGGAGIGRATALLFAREGARVVVADVDKEAGFATVAQIATEGGEATFVAADVSRPDEVGLMVEATLAAFGRLDILVNNAAIYRQGDAETTTEADWQRMLEVNLTGPFLCARYCVPVMRRGGGGVIVNVASEAGLVGIRGQVAYNVTKAGLIGFTRSLAVDGAPAIRANCICPGTSDTPLVAARWRASPTRQRPGARLNRSAPWTAWGAPRRSRSESCAWRPTSSPTRPGPCCR